MTTSGSHDIETWLGSIGLAEYATLFRENDLDVTLLPELTNDDLKDLGVTSLGHRKQILKAIAELVTDERSDTTTVIEPETTTDAERRQLTVMFCDLVGSTALSAQYDPEDLSDIVRTYQDACAGIISRYEGHIARYMGDGMLVYFGYPQAHEDDAERALRTGLEIIERIGQLKPREGLTLQTRVGVATGLVVVGETIGEASSREQVVMGETPNLAARLQGLAEPNQIVIADSTRRLCGDVFEYIDHGTHDLKGFPEAMQTWQVSGESQLESRFEAAATRGLTRLVGREEEIGLLLKRWEQAKDGDGQVVLLSGEAGVGKSRITRGFQERLKDELRNRILYYCSPYHQNTALYPVVDQIERALRFDKEDSDAQKLDKLDDMLKQLGLSVRELAPVLASLLSIPTEGRYPPLVLPPGEAKAKTLETLVTIIEAMAARDPVLMVVEDVHWIDPSTRELLDLVIDRVARVPIVLVITYRLEFESPWRGYGQVTMITLNRLSRRETTAIITNVAGGKALPGEVVDQIVAKTDGVPLFVEELTKTVVESGLLEDAGDHYALSGPLPPLAVPASLQDSLMARLDRLAPVKEVAQLAATIGRTFGYELLAAVSSMEQAELEDALSQLMAAELVYRHGIPPNINYEFKHALVQDAAYASLLRGKRQQYHQRIAQVLEEQFPKIAETEPALLARHYTEAGAPKQAISYWLKAGELLHDQGSVDMSMTTYQKALEIADEDIDRCRALIGLAGGMRVTDEYDNALKALEEAQGIATQQQLIRELAVIHHLRGNLYFPLGNVTGCLEEHEQALHYAQQAGDTECEARALSGLGDAHYSRGRMRTALDYFQRCVALSRQHNFLNIAVGNQYMVAWTRFYINEVNDTLTDALEAVASAVDINYLRAEMVARLTVSRVLVELAELDTALEHIERGLSIADMLGANRFKPFLMMFLARVQLAQNGYRPETVQLMQKAAQISRETSIGFLGPWVLSILALVTEDHDHSRQALKEGEDILKGGDCVGHNYFAFYRTAMETSLRLKDWNEVDRYADALEEYCRPEPLPRCEFYIARGRALAAYGRGDHNEEIISRLTGLRAQAEEVGLKAAIPALDVALQSEKVSETHSS